MPLVAQRMRGLMKDDGAAIIKDLFLIYLPEFVDLVLTKRKFDRFRGGFSYSFVLIINTCQPCTSNGSKLPNNPLALRFGNGAHHIVCCFADGTGYVNRESGIRLQ